MPLKKNIFIKFIPKQVKMPVTLSSVNFSILPVLECIRILNCRILFNSLSYIYEHNMKFIDTNFYNILHDFIHISHLLTTRINYHFFPFTIKLIQYNIQYGMINLLKKSHKRKVAKTQHQSIMDITKINK